MEDKKLHELYNLDKEVDSFIADASRRRIEKDLKRHNFLTFNTNQFNVYFLSLGIVLALIISLFVFSKTTMQKKHPAKTEKLQTPEQQPQTSKLINTIPEKQKTNTPPAQEDKNPIDSVREKVVLPKDSMPKIFPGITEVTGFKCLFIMPTAFQENKNQWLPSIPDSLPKLKDIPKTKRATVKPQINDTVQTADTLQKTIAKEKTNVVADSISVAKRTIDQPVVDTQNNVQKKQTSIVPATTPNATTATDSLNTDNGEKKKRKRKDK